MGKVSVVVRAMNVLVENADPDSFDERRLHDNIIGDGQRAGREFRRFCDNGAHVEIVVPEHHIIDCRQASMPREWRDAGWKVEWQRNLGRQVFTPDAMRLFLSEEQRRVGVIRGDKLRKFLESEPALTDNWLDFLLANPEFIPEEWKGKAVFFWGTGYRSPGGRLFVRCLDFYEERWHWGCSWLVIDWHQLNPAAVLASSF